MHTSEKLSLHFVNLTRVKRYCLSVAVFYFEHVSSFVTQSKCNVSEPKRILFTSWRNLKLFLKARSQDLTLKINISTKTSNDPQAYEILKQSRYLIAEVLNYTQRISILSRLFQNFISIFSVAVSGWCVLFVANFSLFMR